MLVEHYIIVDSLAYVSRLFDIAKWDRGTASELYSAGSSVLIRYCAIIMGRKNGSQVEVSKKLKSQYLLVVFERRSSTRALGWVTEHYKNHSHFSKYWGPWARGLAVDVKRRLSAETDLHLIDACTFAVESSKSSDYFILAYTLH